MTIIKKLMQKEKQNNIPRYRQCECAKIRVKMVHEITGGVCADRATVVK